MAKALRLDKVMGVKDSADLVGCGRASAVRLPVNVTAAARFVMQVLETDRRALPVREEPSSRRVDATSVA